MVYDETPETMRELLDIKVESQFARALRYVEAIGARYIVPSAGPPCFLDDDLYFANMITGDEVSIFPDQREFISRLAAGAGIGIGLVQPVEPQPRTAFEALDQRGPCLADHARRRRVGDRCDTVQRRKIRRGRSRLDHRRVRPARTAQIEQAAEQGKQRGMGSLLHDGTPRERQGSNEAEGLDTKMPGRKTGRCAGGNVGMKPRLTSILD
jgi:hypothetical protein